MSQVKIRYTKQQEQENTVARERN